MIANFKKDAAGNTEFSLHGIHYRIYAPEIDIFTQQDVMAIVSDASDVNGVFRPYTSAGVGAVRKLVAYVQAKEADGNYLTLNQETQRDFFSRAATKNTLSQHKWELDVPKGEKAPHVNAVLHLGALATYAHTIIMDEEWVPDAADPLTTPEGGENSAKQSEATDGEQPSGVNLKKTRGPSPPG